MVNEQIHYFDRYRQEVCVEKVYGDAYLRWIYGSLPGKLALAAAVKRAWFSRWYGWRMDRPKSRQKIEPFIADYGLDADEFLRRPEDFESFNAFFSRQLKPTARPIDPRPEVAVFPADGRHLCVPKISAATGLFVKGQMFSLGELLGDAALAERYADGSLLLSRLCPVDYHRFHFPVAGLPDETRTLNGPLYSVNPIALCQNIRILSTNRRTLCSLAAGSWGEVLVLEVGATCVGGICQTYLPSQPIEKGAEKGYFEFGGSSTITIFPPNSIRFDDDLVEHSSERREVYARMGDHMGVLNSREA